MSTDVVLPKLGFAMTEGMIGEWLVADGCLVEAGELLHVLESDKSAQEVEAPASGRLTILAAPGSTYPVGAILATINSK